jgi:hypothetical protein
MGSSGNRTPPADEAAQAPSETVNSVSPELPATIDAPLAESTIQPATQDVEELISPKPEPTSSPGESASLPSQASQADVGTAITFPGAFSSSLPSSPLSTLGSLSVGSLTLLGFRPRPTGRTPKVQLLLLTRLFTASLRNSKRRASHPKSWFTNPSPITPLGLEVPPHLHPPQVRLPSPSFLNSTTDAIAATQCLEPIPQRPQYPMVQ